MGKDLVVVLPDPVRGMERGNPTVRLHLKECINFAAIGAVHVNHNLTIQEVQLKIKNNLKNPLQIVFLKWVLRAGWNVIQVD